MTGCSAVNCSNSTKNFRLFIFPVDPARRAKWIQNTRRDKWTPSKNAKLCEIHFEESQFEQNRQDRWKKLKPNAIPTLFNVPNPPLRINQPVRKSIYKHSNVKESSTLTDATNNIVDLPQLEKSTPTIVELQIKQEIVDPVWNSQEFVDDMTVKTEVDEVMSVDMSLKSEVKVEDHDVDDGCGEEENDGVDEDFSVDMSLKSEVKVEDHDIDDGCGEEVNDDVDEEIKLPEAVFIKEEVDWEAEEDDEESYPTYGEDVIEEKDGSSGLLDGTSSLKLKGPAVEKCVCTCSNDISNDGSSDSILINPEGKSSTHRPCKKCSSSKTSKASGRKKNNRMYECSICQKRFKQRAYLAAHTRIHTGERPLQCHICLKDFTYRQGLYKHMLTHSEERPHSCSVCQKSFRKREHLVGHMRTHSEEAPYPCTNCEKSFKRKEHLLKHLRTHTEERPHHCSVCEKSFREKAVLLRHMELHTEGMYACSICKKIFRDFAKHMRFHSAEKACECPVCHLSFKVKELLDHLSTHTQGKALAARTVSQEDNV